MSIELDHIFLNVAPGFPEKSVVAQAWPTIGKRRQHPGQGTSAEFVAFAKNYLEFIWLSDQDEAVTNPLRLDQRFSAGQCPFGVAFRGELSPEQKKAFWQYCPSYLEKGCIWIHDSSSDFRLPFLFVVDLPVKNEQMWPVSGTRWSDEEIVTGAIRKIKIEGPLGSDFVPMPGLEYRQSADYKLQIVGELRETSLSPLPIEILSE